MRLKAAHVTNPPNVVADTVVFGIGPVHRTASEFLAYLNGFEHGTVGVARATDVVDLGAPWPPKEVPEFNDQIEPMDVVAHQLALVSQHAIGIAGHRAFHQVGQEAMQHRARMARTS